MKVTREMDGEKISYAHPFFWAPFVTMGETELRFSDQPGSWDLVWIAGSVFLVLVGIVIVLLLKKRS